MEALLGLIVVTAIAIQVARLVRWERRRAHLRVWHAAAQRAGLTDVRVEEGGLFEEEFLLGRSGDLRVRLEGYRRGKHGAGTMIVVTGLAHHAGGLSLRRAGLASAFEKKIVGERDIETGDHAFDDEYLVQGPAPLALAILGPETRRRVAAFLRGRVEVPEGGSGTERSWWRERIEVGASLRDGALVVLVKESGFSENRERVPEILAGVLEVARLLVEPPDVAARIAENLRAEPEPGARLRGVLMLAREFPHHPATRETLLAACGDVSEEVRLRAAMALGEEGSETLVDLVERAGTDDSCAARAVVALGDRLPAERAEAALRRALARGGRPQTTQACLEALALLGRTEAEGLMLDALRSEDQAVAVAAARALGRVGTAAAVLPLEELHERDRSCRGAARLAIAEIQSRLVGAGPGQLSLAGGESGQLSLAEGEAGRLSVAASARGASGESGDEGSAVGADPSGPGPTGIPQDDEAEPSRPGRRGSSRMAE